MKIKTLRPSYLAKDININGVHADNYFLDKPVLQAHGEIYIPATRQMLSALGIYYISFHSDAVVDEPVNLWGDPLIKTIKTWRANSQQENRDAMDIMEFRLGVAEPVAAGTSLVTNLKAYSEIFSGQNEFVIARVSSFQGADFVAANPDCIISHDGSELYFDADGLMYFSCSFLELLGIDCEYDELTGLYISTVSGVSAASLYDEALAHRIDVLSDYICSCNKKLDKTTATEYEYIFRHEANVYGLDETVIMAVAKVESNFRAEAIGNGTVGMMQILEKYAGNYGYDHSMLLTPHYSVELGSKYLMDRYHMFGSEELMLVAYNKGPASVRAGRRHSTYSDKVLGIKNTILGLLNVQS